jgi:hypothetical protein
MPEPIIEEKQFVHNPAVETFVENLDPDTGPRPSPAYADGKAVKRVPHGYQNEPSYMNEWKQKYAPSGDDDDEHGHEHAHTHGHSHGRERDVFLIKLSIA